MRLEKSLAYTQSVADYQPAVLFEHGRDARLVPTVPGFSIDVTDGTFAAGAAVRIGLGVAQYRLNIGFQGEVTNCSLADGIDIRGSAPPFGDAAMWLKLETDEAVGSLIKYGIDLKANNYLQLPALAIIAAILNSNAESFAAQYKENVVRAIKA